MILGGGRALTASKSFSCRFKQQMKCVLFLAENLIDQTDDSVLIPDLTRHLRSALPKVFDKWGKQMSGEGLMTTWTGELPTLTLIMEEIHCFEYRHYGCDARYGAVRGWGRRQTESLHQCGAPPRTLKYWHELRT